MPFWILKEKYFELQSRYFLITPRIFQSDQSWDKSVDFECLFSRLEWFFKKFSLTTNIFFSCFFFLYLFFFWGGVFYFIFVFAFFALLQYFFFFFFFFFFAELG